MLYSAELIQHCFDHMLYSQRVGKAYGVVPGGEEQLYSLYVVFSRADKARFLSYVVFPEGFKNICCIHRG